MKKKYFIPQSIIDISDRDASNSFLAGKNRDGYIRLYNKNSFLTSYFKILNKSSVSFGYFVYSKSKIDSYWKDIIKNIKS